MQQVLEGFGLLACTFSQVTGCKHGACLLNADRHWTPFLSGFFVHGVRWYKQHHHRLRYYGVDMSLHFNSRRSPVLSLHGCVASSNPLASEAGLTTLKAGGNAADAAVAVAAALNVTEPFSTGLGGDCFCLFYSAAEQKVYGLNGRQVQQSIDTPSMSKQRKS